MGIYDPRGRGGQTSGRVHMDGLMSSIYEYTPLDTGTKGKYPCCKTEHSGRWLRRTTPSFFGAKMETTFGARTTVFRANTSNI